MSKSLDSFTLPPLPYAPGALEPHIDTRTMELHHDMHHKGYVTKLNDLTIGTEADILSIDKVCEIISKFSTGIRNNGGGHYNHSFFWLSLSPQGGGEPSGTLADAIRASFDTLDNMKALFAEFAAKRFGSGWVWIIKGADGKLDITSTPNQDNPLMDVVEVRGTPILGLDVWEHAYYLKYQNRRPEYVSAWWDVVNWEEASKRFEA